MTAEEIAAGMTPAQRMAFSKAVCTTDGRWLVPSCSVSLAEPWPQGVAEYYSWAVDRLTPLGQQVRSILEGTSHAD